MRYKQRKGGRKEIKMKRERKQKTRRSLKGRKGEREGGEER